MQSHCFIVMQPNHNAVMKSGYAFVEENKAFDRCRRNGIHLSVMDSWISAVVCTEREADNNDRQMPEYT